MAKEKKKTLEEKLKLDSFDQNVLYSLAHQQMLNEQISKEQAWFTASISILNRLGLKVVDENEKSG